MTDSSNMIGSRTKIGSTISILVALGIAIASCSPKNYSQGLYPVLESKSDLSRYNMEMKYGGNSMSGLLLFRTEKSGEIVIHGSTLFGMTMFNFGIDGDEWRVYSCIEPLKDKRIQKLLESDFRKLFTSHKKSRNIKIYPADSGRGEQVVVTHKLIGVKMYFEKIID